MKIKNFIEFWQFWIKTGSKNIKSDHLKIFDPKNIIFTFLKTKYPNCWVKNDEILNFRRVHP